jgi:CheY-like chemotaxis protein
MATCVLVADRSETLHLALTAALERNGFRVVHAVDGREAVARAADADVVLLARDLTEADALDVVGQTCEQTGRPVIVRSTSEDEDYERRAIEAGARAVLSGPLDLNRLLAEIAALGGDEGSPKDQPGAPSAAERRLGEFIMELGGPRAASIEPAYDPNAPGAYVYADVAARLGLPAAAAGGLLEELVAEGLLTRHLVDKVHLCPSCGWHTLSFAEVCPRCGAIDIGVQDVIQHFACSTVAPAAAFRGEDGLTCPSCKRRLRHFGLDYGKISDTYVCSACEFVFSESEVQARCFRCRQTTPAVDLSPSPVYGYTAAAGARQALKTGHTFGPALRARLPAGRIPPFDSEYLRAELGREMARARRSGTSLTLVLVTPVPSAPDGSDWASGDMAVRAIGPCLARLDVAGRLEDDLLGVLMPETDTEQAVQRAAAALKKLASAGLGPSGEAAGPTAAAVPLRQVHTNAGDLIGHARRVLDWALEQRAGTVVTPDAWHTEAGDA